MLRYIGDKIKMPDWADARFKRLYIADLWLDGQFYDHLQYSFYQETEGDRYIPIIDRRPSVQTNIPNHIANTISRKLFGGRHIPRFVHADQSVVELLNTIADETRLWPIMLKAAYWGSVGSIAVTCKVSTDSNNKGKIVFETWKARECYPIFDTYGELSLLRVARTVLGYHLMKLGYPKPYDKDNKQVDYEPLKRYWWIRDWDVKAERTFVPIEEDAWNPMTGEKKYEHEDDKRITNHNLGFVPGHWFLNLSGGCYPDGANTWEPALNTCIDADYTMSQLGRGIRYSAAPQLVIEGELANWDMSDPSGMRVTRGPAHILQFQSAEKDSLGATSGGGKAYLLDTNGQGILAGISYFEQLRKIALEQISASRKDPDKFSVPQSGKAMEILDEDVFDLVSEQRTNYGEDGVLPLIRKVLLMAKKARLYVIPDRAVEVQLLWPKLYQPAVADLQAFGQAMDIILERALLTPEQAKGLLDTIVDIPPRPQSHISPPHAPEEEPRDIPPTNVGGDTGSGDAQAAVAAPTQPQLLNGARG